MLLAAYDARRPTRDVDMQARAIAGNRDDILRLVRSIAAVSLHDGLTFDIRAATAETIRDDDEYSGVRITLTATMATAKLSLHVDVSVGDPIWPAPVAVELPRLLGGPAIRVVGYPLPMVFAEKIVTALQRGTINTRWRDSPTSTSSPGGIRSWDGNSTGRWVRSPRTARWHCRHSAKRSPDMPRQRSPAGMRGGVSSDWRTACLRPSARSSMKW